MTPELTTAIISIAIAIISYVALQIQTYKLNKKTMTIEQFLTSDPSLTYYILCPHCNNKIELSKVKILYDKN